MKRMCSKSATISEKICFEVGPLYVNITMGKAPSDRSLRGMPATRERLRVKAMMALPSKAACLRVNSSPPLMLAGVCVRLVAVAELAFGLQSAPSFLVVKMTRMIANICRFHIVFAVRQDALHGAHGGQTSYQSLALPWA
eukprot:3820068-Heterocapsa_arctica.AAC.1